jgi:hypothetical protein
MHRIFVLTRESLPQIFLTETLLGVSRQIFLTSPSAEHVYKNFPSELVHSETTRSKWILPKSLLQLKTKILTAIWQFGLKMNCFSFPKLSVMNRLSMTGAKHIAEMKGFAIKSTETVFDLIGFRKNKEPHENLCFFTSCRSGSNTSP